MVYKNYNDMEIFLGIIEDNEKLRNNYKEYFTDCEGFNVSFCINDLNNLQAVANSVKPDIILLDIMLPSGNSLTWLHKIKQIFPVCHIVILSGISDPLLSHDAMNKGVNGFLLKDSSLEYIKDALLKTYHGGTALSPMIANHLLYTKARQTVISIFPGLTKRETQLINILKTGMSNKMAASELEVTFFTINQHLKNIYKKLNINSKSELISFVMKYDGFN